MYAMGFETPTRRLTLLAEGDEWPMNLTATSSLAQLSDQELLAKVTTLAADERQATTLLIAHLAELDARRLYLAEGYASLFAYCTGALRLSEHAAYHRIEAARVSRKFPVLLELLTEGALTLTTLGLLAPHLSAQNHEELLQKSRFRSKRQVEEILANLSPKPSAATVLRRLPTSRPDSECLPVIQGSEEGEGAALSTMPIARTHDRPAIVTPLAPERYKVQFTASKETYEKLQQVRNLMRHQIPDGDLDQIIQKALTALLHDIAAKKAGSTNRPRVGRSTAPNSRHIPAEVRRRVWLRDGGRCAFMGNKGRRCDEVGFLEFHHVKPYADGGEATVGNIQLRCRAHNVYEAELNFGSCDSAVSETPGSYSVRTELLTRNEWAKRNSSRSGWLHTEVKAGRGRRLPPYCSAAGFRQRARSPATP